jgi:hypothetical protein
MRRRNTQNRTKGRISAQNWRISALAKPRRICYISEHPFSPDQDTLKHVCKSSLVGRR